MPQDQQTQLLRSIDAKLAGILALAIDTHLRDTKIAKPKDRSIDRLLKDCGLSGGEIAQLLGKTERAVNKKLAED